MPAFALLGFATQPAWTRPLAAKPLILLGEASYSLYLLHATPIAIMTFILNASPHVRTIVAVYLVAISLFAIAVYLLIENPLRRLLRPPNSLLTAAPPFPQSPHDINPQKTSV